MVSSAPPRPSGVSAPPPKTNTSAPPSSARKNAVKELLGMATIPLATMAAIDTVRSDDENAISPYALDVYTVKMYEEPIADAVVTLAENYPVLGAVLDRIGTTAPFVGLIGAAMALGAQLAENHGALPDGMRSISPGLMDRQTLAAQVLADARERGNGNGTPTDSP